MTDLPPLETRTGLPDALRVLLDAYPRDGWQAHPGFHGLVSFWLDRHLMFRRLMTHMEAETAALLDGGRDGRAFARDLSQAGGMFVQQLHGHHQIEDHHYFPILREREARIARGFDLLDADHHALDGILADFVDQANGVLEAAAAGRNAAAMTDPAARLHAGLSQLERLIGRHLEDEEDLIVPVILRDGAGGLG